MIGPIQEERFEYKGFQCVVMMQPLCFRTGYVGIPKGHRLYKKKYDKIKINCHGGLTYSEKYIYGNDEKDIWWIGFDTGHCMDGFAFDDADELYKGNEEAEQYIESLRKSFRMYDNRIPRSLDFCKNECKWIVDQIIGGEDEQ